MGVVCKLYVFGEGHKSMTKSPNFLTPQSDFKFEDFVKF